MTPRFARLFAALAQVADGPPADPATFVRDRPAVGELPPPWETWALFGLVRHRDRQEWVAEVIRTRLQGDTSRIARAGALGHPGGVPQSGTVPGLPEWEYYFHGRGCRITHKVEGGAIDVDFHDDTADHFDPYFYKWYLESLRRPDPPEQRLRELHPSFDPVVLSIADLESAGVLTRDTARAPRLSPDILPYADAVARFCRVWEDAGQRTWLAALIGDWPAVEATPDRAGMCVATRASRLEALVRTGERGWDALRALADLGPEFAARCLGDALRGEPSGLVSAALSIADSLNDTRWCPDVYAAYTRSRPDGPAPEPHIWLAALKLLLRHGHHTAEVLAALPRAGGYEVGEAVLLALEHAPGHVLPLVRKALLSGVPMNRTTVAAILAVIDRPWSKRELLRALAGSDDQEMTADVRAALLESGDPVAERAVREWEVANPHEPESPSYLDIDGRRVGPFHTFAELMLRERAGRIRYEMQKLHDRVRLLRGVVPPDLPATAWWKFWGR